MSEELVPFEGLLPVLASEARRHRVALGVIFAVIALAALVMGVLWPKKYEASTTILAQESSIITPLMEGAAATTGNKNRAGIARDVIFSSKIMNEVMKTGGWLAAKPSPVEQDRIAEGIKARTKVQFSQDNLITISYYDSDPKRAYEVTREFGKLFISESLASKQRESRDAFMFINSQVEAYRLKLTSAENKLKDYREANVDARPGSEDATNGRISQLRMQVENSRMDLMEKRSQEASLNAQLSGESEITAVQTTQGVYQAQLADLQTQLDKLLLTYTPEYPDVVRTRHQIQDIQQQLAQENVRKQNAKKAGVSTALDSSAQFNPLYQQLKSQLSAMRSDIAASTARMGASQSMLQSEIERSNRIAGSENATAELTRDYDVNRNVYQDLLKRREIARVSMEMDAEHQGLTFLVQNPPVMPLTPVGLRFLHFGIAGIFLALAIPVGLLFGLVRYDPRVRSTEQLERLTGVTVLAMVPFYPTPMDRRRERVRNIALVLVIAGVACAYLVLFWLKLRGLA
jgi:polysaccharide chain length determinant protein (PEP-CTERM system associated)